jgi:hypothetical protein
VRNQANLPANTAAGDHRDFEEGKKKPPVAMQLIAQTDGTSSQNV